MNQSNRTSSGRPPLAQIEGGLAWVPKALADVAAVQEVVIPATSYVDVEGDTDAGPHLVFYARPADTVPALRIRIGAGSALERMDTAEALVSASRALRADLEDHNAGMRQR
ncbi:hypothetical protein ACWFMI_23990 [Nocardiopsis terrae]|uniref:hypothetical protein n=1 Tax=Streptomyces sp. NPDC057554 TaxID=3350538 RepID=UPI0036D048D4